MGQAAETAAEARTPRVLSAVHYQSPSAPRVIAEGLGAGYVGAAESKARAQGHTPDRLPRVRFVCVGSTRFAGDSLGPRVGARLRRSLACLPEVAVRGTMADPVHGANLSAEVDACPDTGECVIVVDGVVGEKETLGTCLVGCGRFQPGEAVDCAQSCGRPVPAFGDLYVVACVGVRVLPGCCFCLPPDCLEEIGDVLAGGMAMFSRSLSAGVVGAASACSIMK